MNMSWLRPGKSDVFAVGQYLLDDFNMNYATEKLVIVSKDVRK